MWGRRIIVGALVWVMLAAQAPEPKAEPKQEQPAAQVQPAPTPRPLPVEIVNQSADPAGYQGPCKGDESDSRSDLCAQWTAANAARDAASYAWLQLWAAGAGMIGLLVTIWWTRQAVKAARRSIEISQDTAKRQLRAYMSIKSVGYFGFGEADGVLKYGFVHINSGQTPALRYRAMFRCYVAKPNTPLRRFERSDLIGKSPNSIGPGQTKEVRWRIVRKISEAQLKKIYSGSLSVFIVCRYVYADIYGARYDGEVAFRSFPKSRHGLVETVFEYEKRRNQR